MNTKEFKKLKEERVNDILNDDTLSKIEKLKTIEDEKLWGHSKYIQNEFKEWEKEAKALEKLEAERILREGSDDPHEICAKQFYQSKMTDSIFDPSHMEYKKRELVSYADALLKLAEDTEEDSLIAVITTRHPYVELNKSFEEIMLHCLKARQRNFVLF